MQEDDQAGRLGVERTRDIFDGSIHELLDLGIWHGALVGELIDGTAGLGQLDEGVGVSHYGGCSCETASMGAGEGSRGDCDRQ